MFQERKMSIYIAEFPNRNEDTTRYHTALFLVDEGSDEPEVVQQLHYNDHANDLMDELQGIIRIVPNIRHGLKSKTSLGDLHVYPIIGGHETDMLQMWNHILAHSIEVRSQELLFDYHDRNLPHANNCRAGIISALASIGIGVEDEYYASDAGTIASRIAVSSVFNTSVAPALSLSEVIAENERLTAALIPPWEMEESSSITGLQQLIKE